MKNLIKKLTSVFVASYLLGLFLVPLTHAAVNCDLDKDGYITISDATMAIIDSKLPYKENGNYDPIQWNSFYGIYTSAANGGVLTPAEQCANINFKKGAEPTRCDSPIISADSGVYDSSKVSSLAGNRVNPGAFDTPNDGIDQNCDGGDGKFVTTATASSQNLGSLVNKTINLLARAVVVISVVILIYGGILYATAAGDEQKTSKARKAIIGAIIGLIVGLLAPSIVVFITSQLA